MKNEQIMISPRDAKQMLDARQAVLIDVREQDEYDQEHIAGAKLHPLSEIKLDAIKADAGDKPVIIHCLVGGRAMKAREAYLLAHPETAPARVMCLDGSITGWMAAGLPVRKNTPVNKVLSWVQNHLGL